MKNLLIVLLALYTVKSLAQDAQLYDNYWYIHDVVISGNSNIPPSSPTESITTSTEFFGVNFLSHICDSIGGTLSFDDALSNFSFLELYQTLSGGCSETINHNFEAIYFAFYFNNMNNPFTYAITQNTNSKTLIVTSVNGDYVEYGSATLGVDKNKMLDIEISPNPVIDVLTITNKSRNDELKVNVFNIEGQLELALKIQTTENPELNIEKLKTGVYFFVFETNDGRKETKKIVKK
ncbi:T9SS type A sorting domain-containing protein [Lacinutrix chionoecetis]